MVSARADRQVRFPALEKEEGRMFRFRLERVLAYRRLQMETLEQELLQSVNALQQEETVLEGLHTSCRQQQEALAASEGQRFSGETLQMWHRHYRALEARVQLQQAVVVEVTQALAVKQQEVIAARQKKKMLEKLADIARQRHSMQMARYEQQSLDEIATTRLHHGY
jgi:flagellar export protein FliJ